MFAPCLLRAQEAGQAGLWLTLFERPAKQFTDDPSADMPVPTPYGRIGLTSLSSFLFQRWDGQMIFRGSKPTRSESQILAARRQKFQVSYLYGPTKPELAKTQKDEFLPLYNITSEDSVIFIEKAHFEEEENAERLRQLNMRRKNDRKELATFEDNPLFVLEKQGEKVDIWQIISTHKGFRLAESIVITDAGNTLKFYNGRPPSTDEKDDWTIKVAYSGFMSDRLGYIEANDAEIGWQLRQSNEAPIVGVS